MIYFSAPQFSINLARQERFSSDIRAFDFGWRVTNAKFSSLNLINFVACDVKIKARLSLNPELLRAMLKLNEFIMFV